MSTIEQKIKVMQAFERGEKIEWRAKDYLRWYTCDNPLWNWDMHEYRIAPESEQVENEPVCEWVKADGANYLRQKWHKDYVAVEGDKLYTTPQPDRTAELEQLRQRVAELEKELSEVRKADGESAAREIRAMGDE